MFDECRSYYKKNHRMLEQIDRFAQTYRADDAIREYTRDGFLYRIINHALRTQNMETIKRFSPFITDLNCQIHECHRKYYKFKEQRIRSLYRGQYLSSDQLEYIISICKSRNPLIKLTTFISASLNPEVALDFARPSRGRIPCLFEIIIPNEYHSQHENQRYFQQAFANISLLSFIPSEQEVLFSLVTHFRVKYAGDSTVQSYRPWVPIVLELVRQKGQASSTYFSMVECIENVTSPQIYSGILDILQVNATDEERFNKMNWQKCWNKFRNLWATDIPHEQPLLLTIYDCFTDDRYYLRKAIEMHKEIIHSNHHSRFNSLSFLDLLNKIKDMQTTPTKGIALYEEYLKQFCTANTKEVIECLKLAGNFYQLVHDNERALESYQQILDIDVHNQHKRNDEVQKSIKQLNKTDKAKKNQHTVMIKGINKDFQRIYPAQQEQWTYFWGLESHKDKKDQKRASLSSLQAYLITREQWHLNSDLNIILRLPFETTEDTSIAFYRCYSLLAIQTHILSPVSTTDSTNNRSLSLLRYEKYINEWIIFNQLNTFLKRFQQKSNLVRLIILPKLDQLINILTLLITVCTFYICIDQQSNKVNVDNIPLISMTNTNMKQLVFFDLNDKDLLAYFEALPEETQTSFPTLTLTPDEAQFFALYM